MLPEAEAWLQRVHHDLVKRLLWPARDRQSLGGPLSPGELVVQLVDDDGRTVDGETLWQALREQAPPALSAPAAQSFGEAVALACAAAGRDDLLGVLALDGAFQVLARNVKGDTVTPASDPLSRK